MSPAAISRNRKDLWFASRIYAEGGMVMQQRLQVGEVLRLPSNPFHETVRVI